MAKTIYLINPADGGATYFGADILSHYGLRPAALIADLTTTTVAALIPDDFDITICDEHIEPADLNTPADIIGLTGKSSQVARMIELADAYRQRGKLVMIGGPFASLCPDSIRPHCDILVRGEIEEIAEVIFADLRAGTWQAEYVGGRPDLRHSPMPRWDLYPNERASEGCVQTSRGCPFECEFCDVIQYVGRKQRHKTVEQVLAELDVVYKLGYRSVFLADDNLTVHRRHARALLQGLRDWNDTRTQGRVFFRTQVSIDTARDDSILQLLSEAGPFSVYIGLETPNEESLREAKKRQNLRHNMVDEVHRFFEHGISITGGMIVGFDADGPDIFERQYEFAMATSIPIFNPGALVAPAATPLYERMKQENRLVSEDFVGANQTPWETNIIPKGMTGEQLLSGLRWLCNRLYHPDSFGERVLGFIDKVQVRPGQRSSGAVGLQSAVHVDVANVVRRIAHLGPREAKMMSNIFKALSKKPTAGAFVVEMLFKYMQTRHLYEQAQIWESDWIAHPPSLELAAAL